MVDFPPLAPSVKWFVRFFASLSEQASLEKGIQPERMIRDAIVKANEGIMSTKEFGRFRFTDAQGNEIMFSLAVEGGGRQLRRLHGPETIKLSEHGAWRKVHIGALESILGRKPYYRHIEDTLKGIILDRNLTSLKDYNMAIFRALYSFLMKNITERELVRFRKLPQCMARGKEIAKTLKPEASILEAIASEGDETLLGILSLTIGTKYPT